MHVNKHFHYSYISIMNRTIATHKVSLYNIFAGTVLSLYGKGCDCCVHNGTLVPEGGWTIIGKFNKLFISSSFLKRDPYKAVYFVMHCGGHCMSPNAVVFAIRKFKGYSCLNSLDLSQLLVADTTKKKKKIQKFNFTAS